MRTIKTYCKGAPFYNAFLRTWPPLSGPMLKSARSMFCPKCKAEYIRGVTRCSDCDVALVDRLSESGHDSDQELSDANLRGVWSGEDQNSCVITCEQLRNADIPYKVIQRKSQFLKGVDEHYEIGVPTEFYSRAKEIADSDRADFSDEPDDQKIMEIPAEDSTPDTTELGKDWDPDKWDSESATVEIQFRNEREEVGMIESSLRENYIHYSADVLGNGVRKIFVMPKDELRSYEIVREIENGNPPK
jgi:hypothetical protein